MYCPLRKIIRRNNKVFDEKGVISILLFENCSFYYGEEAKSDRPFIVGIKDREHSDGSTERWNLVSLTEDDASSVYELLKQYFKD